MDLKVDTAIDVLIGPFLDSTDGDTEETGLTLAQADIKLSKNGQALAQKNDATTATHDANGYYNCELDATDTNTEGNLVLIVHKSGSLSVRHEFNVLCKAAFDSLYSEKNTGFMDVNIKSISGDGTAADNLELACDNYSATRGLSGTALPAAAADAAGGLPISDGGGLDMDAILVDTNSLNDTKIPHTLNTTASGNIGIDWANVENPTTALDLSGTDIQLCDTITTYTGDTPQTADHTAAIADIPTVAEFNARTLPSADYVVTTDTIAGVTLVATTTDVTNGVSLVNDAITAAKFDETTAFPVKSADAGATEIARTGADGDTLETLSDQIDSTSTHTPANVVDEWETQSQADPTGFHVNVLEIAGTAQTANDNGADINAILADTNELQTDWTNGGRLDLILDSILEDTGTTLPASIAALNDITAADVWSEASALSGTPDFGTLSERTYQLLQNKLNITDATGAAALRTIGDGGDTATWSITDDNTTTVRTEVTWA